MSFSGQSFDWKQIEKESLSDFQQLLRINTTNPPGNEKEANDFLAEQLLADGIEPEIFTSAPNRTNLVAQIIGKDTSLPPLMLSTHVDVVPALERWTHPPFDGVIQDGFLWGRGAIDMKNMATMALWVMKLIARGEQPRRTLRLVSVADEEMGCEWGSQWMVNNHPEKVRAGEVISEIGGFTLTIQGKKFYPIQVAEKGHVLLKMKVKGRGGHGSIPQRNSSIAELSKLIALVTENPLPKHITPVQEDFIRTVGRNLPFPLSQVFPLLLKPLVGDGILSILPEAQSGPLDASMRNTVSPTVLRAGNQSNVIPAEAEVLLDGRTLPGFTSADLLQELKKVVGSQVDFEIVKDLSPVWMQNYQTPLFETMCQMIRKHDPDGIPVPWLCNGFTDAKAWSRLGAKCYGFSPVMLPKELPFSSLFHGIDERIPVQGFHWGLRVLFETIQNSID